MQETNTVQHSRRQIKSYKERERERERGSREREGERERERGRERERKWGRGGESNNKLGVSLLQQGTPKFPLILALHVHQLPIDGGKEVVHYHIHPLPCTRGDREPGHLGRV